MASASPGRLGDGNLPRINTDIPRELDDEWHHNPQPSISSIPAPLTPRTSLSSRNDSWIFTPLVFSQNQNKNSNRARQESRKLLSHVLTQLHNRTKPPPALDEFLNYAPDASTNRFGGLVGTVKEALNIKNAQQERVSGSKAGLPVDDDGEDDNHVFSTEATFDLMVQLKDVLNMSISQGWQIFDDGNANVAKGTDPEIKAPSPFRRSYSDPASENRNEVELPELLSSCVSVLASVVLEDCRYRIANPRPSRPPNSLQALTLDIARFLVHAHRQNPKILAQISFAMTPAFYTYHEEMHARLLTFFEDSILRGALQNLGYIQGSAERTTSPAVDSPMNALDGYPQVSIQIDEANDNVTSSAMPWNSWSSADDSSAVKVQSTFSPKQSLQVYRLASLVSPLLVAVLESIEIESSDTRVDTIYRFWRLVDLIVNLKVDAYDDLLQVAAYRSGKSRRLAISLLFKYWPRAIGHAIISRPLGSHSASGDNRNSILRAAKEHAHQFVPWQYTQRSAFDVDNISQTSCRCCTQPVQGFGLLCPFCMCGVHFDCYDYPEGSCAVQYSLSSGHHVQRMAVYRFSKLIPDHHVEDTGNQIRGHLFNPVNIFTTCLCFVCHKPLWGCVKQGLKCDTCNTFIHFNCLSIAKTSDCSIPKINSNHISAHWDSIRQSFLEFYDQILKFTLAELRTRSYEEISTFFAVLWIQLQLLTNGLALGSLVILQDEKNSPNVEGHQLPEFELHRIVKWCQELLVSGELSCSHATEIYMLENHKSRPEHAMLFDWSNLIYMTSAIKSPSQIEDLPNVSPNLLNVANGPITDARTADGHFHPFEVVPLSYIRDILGRDFLIHEDSAAKLILEHLHHLAFFGRRDGLVDLFEVSGYKDVECAFPIPLGIDLSGDVETIFSCLESCLKDVDLSVNEFGLLLLVRRLSPNGLTSEYGLKRLARSVLLWILDEDSAIASILRDFVAKQKNLPGMRSALELPLWPLPQGSRQAPTSSRNNGGDYVAARRSLLSQYALPWLLAFHGLDATLYASLIHEVCCEAADEVTNDYSNMMAGNDEHEKSVPSRRCDDVLRFIIKLSHASVIFTVFDAVFFHWLKQVSSLELYNRPMASLHRLFPRETEASYYFMGNVSDTIDPSGESPLSNIDPWRVILSIAGRSKEDLSQSLQWLGLFSRSGIDIPGTIFMKFSSLIISSTHSSLEDSLFLVEAVMTSVWLKSLGRQELQLVFSSLHSRFSLQLVDCIKSEKDAETALSFIRKSLAACLLLYGCDRSSILSLGMIREEEIKDLPSRRKTNRGSQMLDPIVIDQEILEALHIYVTADVNDISCLIANFFSLFFSDSPFLEQYEVDNFVLRNSQLLSSWYEPILTPHDPVFNAYVSAWQFYGIQRSDISSIRTSFLLRILVVDADPFREVLHRALSHSTPWEKRLLSVTRLFRIILDVTSPSFNVEGRQWRSSTADIFFSFFSAIWIDPREEIRLAATTYIKTLLPSHLEAISLCWNESLAKAPVAERLKLVSFLLQLRPHLPGCKVLSWETILEALLEYGYDQRNHDNIDPRHQRSNSAELQIDPESAHLRVAIILLSLQMVSDGVSIDSFTLMKMKVQLVRLIGFKDISVVPSAAGHTFHIQFGDVEEIPEIALPCVNELASVLDAFHHVNFPKTSPSSMIRDQEARASIVLVGSTFVDVTLSLLSSVKDLASLPVSTLKSLLEALYIAIYKYELDKSPAYLQKLLLGALARVLELLTIDACYEVHQLALTAVQAFVKRSRSVLNPTVYSTLECAAQLVSSDNSHSQDPLVIQSKLLIETTLQSYCNTGLFLQLLKRKLHSQFFLVIKQIIDARDIKMTLPAEASQEVTLQEALLRDALFRAAGMESWDLVSLQNVLNNILSYVEVVYHKGYSAELLSLIGQNLTHLAKRMSDGTAESVDPSPLLITIAILIQQNKKNSKDMLASTDTLLRVLLNRLDVSSSCLKKLIGAAFSSNRRSTTSESVPGIASVIFEILCDALRMKSRAMPNTIVSIIEVLTIPDTPGTLPLAVAQIPGFSDLIDSGYYFLQHYVWTDVRMENEFLASLAVARMIFRITTENAPIFGNPSDIRQENLLCPTMPGIRAWNIMALAALQEISHPNWRDLLLPCISTFGSVYFTVLRPYVQRGSISLEAATTSINHAYIAMKLWLMLASKSKESVMFSIWNELWPPFEAFVDIIEVEAQTDPRSPLIALISTTMADLLIFLHTLRTPLALLTSIHIATLNRLRALNPGESSSNKLNRALKNVSEAPPDVSLTVLLDQIAKEIVATEKLKILEAKKEASRALHERRGIPDRYRRDI